MTVDRAESISQITTPPEKRPSGDFSHYWPSLCLSVRLPVFSITVPFCHRQVPSSHSDPQLPSPIISDRRRGTVIKPGPMLPRRPVSWSTYKNSETTELWFIRCCDQQLTRGCQPVKENKKNCYCCVQLRLCNPASTMRRPHWCCQAESLSKTVTFQEMK